MSEHKMIPILEIPINEFPETDELPQGVKTVKLKDTYGYRVDFLPNVSYINRDGRDLSLQILIPQKETEGVREKCPAIIYIQGSAWHKQSLYGSLNKLIRMAEKGYVVAIVEYRPSEEAIFPAQIEDTKTAYQFMKMNSENYYVDTENMVFWGDSSGAHTALMCGITCNDYPIADDYKEQEINPKCIVDWYGPTEIYEMSCYPSLYDHDAPDSPEGMLIGGLRVSENKEIAERANPLKYLCKEKPTPPILIMHGGSDALVHFNQSCRLYEKLKELEKQVEFIKLIDANHGFGGFDCDEALNMVDEFIKKYIV
jgi:acetyl esterase/lipase